MDFANLILCNLWMQVLVRACCEDELSRGLVLSWFREQVLEGLRLGEPPLTLQRTDGEKSKPQIRQRYKRVTRTTGREWIDPERSLDEEITQITMFSTPDSTSDVVGSSPPNASGRVRFTYHFQPSINYQTTTATSAQFWFFAGESATNFSAPLFFNSTQQLLLSVEAPSNWSSDGWITYVLDQNLLESLTRGPFQLQVHCPASHCDSETDKTSFLHLHVRRKLSTRSRRQAELNIPWSPSAIYLFQRPSEEKPQHSDCHRAEIEISFEELGWDNWIIHPKTLTFYYCYGNCSAGDRITSMLGIAQCCAPVPGTMKSLKITTTSDGGYSFKHETLPNIMPEECICI